MTDYTNVPIAAAGDWIDDAYLNTYLGDNFRAIFGALTGAGQLLVSLAANRLSKVAVTGNNGYVLQEDTSLPEKMKFAPAPESLPAGGSAYQGLRVTSGGSTKEWAALLNLLGRQGGSASDWSTAGSGNYTPTNSLMQTGCLNVTSTSSVGGQALAATVTFPVAFTQPPAIFLTVASCIGVAIAELSVYSLSGSQLGIAFRLNSGTITIPINWMAIGPK